MENSLSVFTLKAAGGEVELGPEGKILLKRFKDVPTGLQPSLER